MKKIFAFFRSMRFGMLLLGITVLCALAGSIIEQGNQQIYYLNNYSWGELLLFLRLDRIFSSWYFLAIMSLLCLNLTFCSIARLKNAIQLYKTALERISAAPLVEAGGQELGEIEQLFRSRHMHRLEAGGTRLYYKGRLGIFGSFITHLGLLITLVLAGLNLGLSSVEEYKLLPGERVTLSDGSTLALSGFALFDNEGNLDYQSQIIIEDSEGASSGLRRIGVNTPLHYGGHKYYQQSYGVLGRVGINTHDSQEVCFVKKGSFLSIDGENGALVLEIYPDYLMDGDRIIPLSSGSYDRALYALSIYEGENQQVGALFVGDVLEAAGIQYSFYAPEFSSGIRVKTTPCGLTAALYGGFIILLFGLYLCFFAIPSYGRISEEGYAYVCAKKDPWFQKRIDRISKGEH